MAVISGIKKYSREHADVCLFGKVLRNEVDEEFRWVQQALREIVNGLVKKIVREKHAIKGEVKLSLSSRNSALTACTWRLGCGSRS